MLTCWSDTTSCKVAGVLNLSPTFNSKMNSYYTISAKGATEETLVSIIEFSFTAVNAFISYYQIMFCLHINKLRININR